MHGFLVVGLTITAIGSGVTLLGWAWVGRLIARQMLDRHNHRCKGIERPEDRGLPTRRFRIPTRCGNELAAWIITPKKNEGETQPPCVVMVHGYSSHKDCQWSFSDEPNYLGSMLDQGAHELHTNGFAVVAIDLRNHGETDSFGPTTLGQDESLDVLDTVSFLIEYAEELEIDSQRIGLRGESMGAATSLIAAGRGDEVSAGAIQCVWCDSAFADAERVVGDFLVYAKVGRKFAWPVRFWLKQITRRDFADSSPLKYIRNVRCPVFVVHSRDDGMIPIWHYEKLIESRPLIKPEFWLLSGHRHNRLWKEPEYGARQIEFFKRHLSVA